MVTIHLIGTGPKVMKSTPTSADDIEEVLQAVDVPYLWEDLEILERIQLFEALQWLQKGERCLLASANLGWVKRGQSSCRL